MTDLIDLIRRSRQRVLAGESLSTDEQRELIQALRANRHAASTSGTEARTARSTAAKTKTGLSDDDLDASLGDLGL
jgi:uncharacterized membrane protein